MTRTVLDTFPVPGSSVTLTYERAASGRLVRLSAGAREYFAEEESGEKTYGEGLARVREVTLENGLVRHVRAAGQSWIEEYLWDEVGRPLRIDGVEIARDEKRRVIACGEWRYAYAGDDLVVIGTPKGVRRVTRGVDGRPVATRNGHGSIPIRYHDDGARMDVAPLPPTWNRDRLGRLWTICDAHGRVETTFLWNGFACIGRIDGDAGAPLAAFFSLDPSSTPVRVVTAGGVTRIPRDAFGESLLAHDRVPGLYGGAIHDGFVYLRSRALDPRCGSFDRRDPLHGRTDDPRRANGFDGPLPVEDPPCGPYAVCQYDPVGRVDPTGEASTGFKVGMGFLYTVLDATWALQNNTAGLFGLDWTIAFWFSVIGGIAQAIGRSEEKNLFTSYFDFEPMYNERTGVWGMRRALFGDIRGFVFQHIITVPAERYNELNAVAVLVPPAKFEPALYGTLLHVAPAGYPPLLLRGNGDNAVAGWSRSGGEAVPIAPGSPVPRFPFGGLHLDKLRDDIRVPLQCDVTELVPAGTPLLGTVDEPRIATTIPFARELEVGKIVLLSDAADVLDIKTVAEVDDKHASQESGRRVRFTEPGLHVATTGVRLRGLGDAKDPDKGRTSPAPKHIDIAASTVDYEKDDLLRFTQAGTVVGAAVVESFEAQLVLDSGTPAGFVAPLELRVVAAAGKGTKGTLDGVKLKTAKPPSKGDPIVVLGAGKKVAAIVTKEIADDEVELDRTAAELAPLGAAVTWKPLISGTKLGEAASLPAGATLSYTPETLRQAPASGFLLLRDASKPARTAVRLVASRNFDAIVTKQDLPGDTTKPYDLEIFPIRRPDIEKLTLKLDPRIKLAAPAPAVSAKALQIVQLTTPAVEAAVESLTVAGFNGKEATMASVAGLEPSQFVVLSGGGKVQPNVITRISATIGLDRQLALSASDPIDVIAISPTGPLYDMEAVDATRVVVHATSGGNAMQFPRFEKGAIVQVIFGGNTSAWFVDAVDGTTLTLKGGPAGATIPAAPAAGLLQLIVPVKSSPSNDTWRIGMKGKPVGAGPTTNKITADIWDDDHVSFATLVALVQNGVTQVAKIALNPSGFVVTFLAAVTVGNTGDVTIPGISPSTTAVFTQKNEFVTLADVTGPALVQGPNAVVVISYGPGTIAPAKMEMSSGTVRVPVDAEKYEIDRRKSLVWHELTHTRQAQFFGPLFLASFPLFVLEGVLEGGTDFELPKFSKYVGATITSTGGNLFLQIPDQGVAFDNDAKVQVEQNGAHLITLGSNNGNVFLIQGGGELLPGAVQVRRLTDDGGWGTFRDVSFNILSGLTLGGVTNYVAGTVWGGLLYLLFKLIHFFSHRLGEAGQEFPAVVVDPLTVRMTSDEGRRAIQGFQRIFLLQGGERSDLLDVERIDNDTITLQRNSEFTGNITVTPYSSDDPLSTTVVDTLTYFNATVPDPAKPAQIAIQNNGDDELKLEVFDRVSVNAGTTSRRTNVTAVTGGLVELEDAPPTFGPNRELRIAFVDEHDPMGGFDGQLVLTELGMGWMRSFFDPWRQLHFGLDPKPGSAGDWIARFARYSFSSHSWSAAIPGVLFFDNLFKQRKDKGHLSRMEQQAANESGGSPYSPLAKIRGGFADGDGHAQKKAKVGDIARYWYTPQWDHGEQPIIVTGRLDQPGLGIETGVIEVVPQVGAESIGGTINKGATSGAARPGTFVPDAFYAKRNAADPESPSGILGGVLPAGRGFIPPTPALELSLGHYVAFAKPGRHRVTVSDLIPHNDHAREAHDEQRQTIFFDVTVSDVTVKVGSTVVPRKDTPEEVKLLPGQSVSLKVDSDGEWRLTAERNDVVGISKDGKALTLVSKTAGASETVEVSRVYEIVNGKYADPVLSQHGVNLPVPIHVPVRQFKVGMRENFELVGELKPNAAAVTSAKAGETVFALLPGRIPAAATLTPTFASPPPNPAPVITPVTVPKELGALIGEGRIYRIDLPVDEPPEEPVTITFTIAMGPDPGIPVTAKLEYLPHFQLAAPSFEIAVNTNRDLTSAVEIGKAFAVSGPPGAKVEIAPDGKSINVKIAERAPGGSRRIMAWSQADPMQRALRTINVPAVVPATFDATFEDLTAFVTRGLATGADASTGALIEPAPSSSMSVLDALDVVQTLPIGTDVKLLVGESFLDAAAFAGTRVARPMPGDPTQFQVRVSGRIYYPSAAANPGQVAGPVPVPVVAIVHGQHASIKPSSFSFARTVTVGGVSMPGLKADPASITEEGNHLGYEDLQRELARNGIASISVDTNLANYMDALIQSRADMVLATLDEWKRQAADPASKFHDKLDFNRVGLVGHSRGGDAVVRAAKDNLGRLADKYGITAVCSLSPTDFTGTFSNAVVLTPADKLVYLVVYGSHDNDVAGRAFGTAGAFASETGTGFRHYDRAACDKAMVFIHRACHNRFNTNWGTDRGLDPADPELLLDSQHLAASDFYIGGFFRWILGGEAQLQERFTGDAPAPGGLTTALQWSFGDELRRVDTFEKPSDNELGQARKTQPYAQVIRFGDLRVTAQPAQGPHIPYQTNILDADVTIPVSNRTALGEPIPAADWSGLSFLTFRIGRWFNLNAPPFPDAQPHVKITIADENGKDATVAESLFFTAAVPGKPFHHKVGAENLTFHRLETVRIPLTLFRGIDLHRVKRVSVILDSVDNTHVFLDSIEVVRV